MFLLMIKYFMNFLLSPPDGATVLDLLQAHRALPFALWASRLGLFAIRIRFAPSVRKSAFGAKSNQNRKPLACHSCAKFNPSSLNSCFALKQKAA